MDTPTAESPSAFAQTSTTRADTDLCGEIAVDDFPEMGLPATENARLIAHFGTTQAGLLRWQQENATRNGAVIVTDSPSPVERDSDGEAVSICYFDGAFGSPRGPAGVDARDYDRVVVFVFPDGRFTLGVGGYQDLVPVIDPNGLG